MSDTIPDLQALQQGDERAWTQAFHALWPCAYHAALAAGAGLTPDEAEDVAIEALTQLVACIASVTSEGGLKALTATISRRQAISLARRKSAAKRPEIGLHLDAPTESEKEPPLPDQTRDGALSESDAAELLQLLHQTLAAEDETTRQLLIAHHLDGLTIRELSGKTGLPAGTVSTRLARGLQSVRVNLQRSPRLLKELRAFLRFN